MFSIATAPAKQSVGDTISILSGRLASATLLEDRRAAILGLRSFAKEYPASVASGALRSLIGSLSKDGEDVDTVKVVLETLLMLFNPNEDSPEASEEIALWLADEFTQRQENISLLLDFLESGDFYSRLYSLQLLAAILSARTERTEECVLNARLGISRLVAILDDRRDAIRNEGIALLTYLTPTSLEIQKLVAFESAFERVFAIIESEGGLIEGDRVVEDCLILLANLLRLNSSNQSLFRETGYVPRLSRLLETAYTSDEDGKEIAAWAEAQKNRNIYALLAVIRLFLDAGSPGTVQNQAAFWQHGILYHALQLAFSPSAEIQIRSEALVTCADIIRGNTTLQENFAQLQVLSPLDLETGDTNGQTNGAPKVFVIDGLLDITLGVQALQVFDLRLAACECLKAYFFRHDEVRQHFLRRAIEGHKSDIDETGNILTTLLRPPGEMASSDPYKYWFAAVLMLHLLNDNPATKALAMAVTEGDESKGEEVVTSIQTITAHLLGSISRGEDSRISVGYLMLLICWLFEDLDGVNDFLGEGSNVQGLIQGAIQNAHGDPIVQGLCAMLLGVVYEFSTKDSPIPRASLQPILTSRLGRDRYVEKLSKLRSHPFMRDYEVLPQKLDLLSGQKLPDVYFDSSFVDFFKDNYSRLIRAIDREPVLEISVVTNGVQKGISREMVDSLRSQVEDQGRALQSAQLELESLGRRLEQQQADHKQEVAKLKSVNEGLQRHHDEELAKLRTQHSQREQDLEKQIESARKAAASEAEKVHRRVEAEKADLRATISRLEVDVMKANTSKAQELQSLRKEYDTKLSEQEVLLQRAKKTIADLETTVKDLKSKCASLEERLKSSEEETQKMASQLEQKDEEKQAVQTELDDLLMVFGDLEEKTAKYKDRLKALGEPVSDGEEEEKDEGEEDEDEAG
ncbi:hypothetical protein VTK73DRAFT_3297 [Phialemonium thermophilum]|uniref:Uncharacterized protein n=1 Tax=Phialemonium thermophilum TaxID=223376 RepID=A0ABR3Y273_9PEZI